MSSAKEEVKGQPSGGALTGSHATRAAVNESTPGRYGTEQGERQHNSAASVKASRQSSQFSEGQKQAGKSQQQTSSSMMQTVAGKHASKESQSGSKSTLVSKQFSASSNKQSESGRQSLADGAKSSVGKKEQQPVVALRRTTRDSKPSNKLQASKEGISLAAAIKQSSATSRKEAAAAQNANVGSKAEAGLVRVAPPQLALTIPTSSDSPSRDAQDQVLPKELESKFAPMPTVRKWKAGADTTAQKDLKAHEEDHASEAHIDIIKEKVDTKPSTKKEKSGRAKEDPEEDATVSDEEDEEEDSCEDEDDDEDDDEEDDGDASVSMHQSGAVKKGRMRRSKQKQTSRKLWSKQEDDAIVELVKEYGTKKWTFVANKLEEKFKIRTRTGKQCRERWHNHLDPYINKTPINKVEEKKIFDLHKKLGNKWADIAKELPGRSDNCIKNYFYSTHRKHQRRINKSLRNFQVGKQLGFSKHLTAEELHKLVIQKKTMYEDIRRMDPVKFMDLEATMRMLYDHGNMKFDSSSHSLEVTHTTNASMREPKRLPAATKGKRAVKAAVSQVSAKRKARPESLPAKQPQQSDKPTKRAKTDGGQTGGRAANARASAAQSSVASVQNKASKSATIQDRTETMTVELDMPNERIMIEQGEDPYQNQQSTPVFVDKNDTFVDRLHESDLPEQEQNRKRQKKAKGKESAAQKQALKQVVSSKKDSPNQSFLPQITLQKQESSGKEKGFHKLPYTNQQPGPLQLGQQQSQGTYKAMGLGLRGFQPQFGLVPPPHMGYMSRGYPMHHQFHPLNGLHHHHGSIDPACLTKYELAWGVDPDRLTKGYPAFKSGELPPATPDTSMMFKDMNMGRPFRNPMLYPGEKMFNLSMNSPMFIPFMNEASPRPPTTRQHFQATAGQPGSVNFTLNLNVNSDYRPSNQTISTPQHQKQCQQCGSLQCHCHEPINLDKSSIFKTFQIDGQKSATQSMSQTKLINLRPTHYNNANNMMSSQPSMQGEEQLYLPNSQQMHSGLVSDKKNASELKQQHANGSAMTEIRNKEGAFCLSALNSDNKQPQQSFMTKLNQAAPMTLLKDVSFGGPQSSVGVISGMPSSSTVKNKVEGVVFAPSVASQQNVALTQLMNRSVTPRPHNAVTPVTVGAQDIHTPKYMPPMTLQSVMAQEGPSTNHEAEVASHKSQSQRSAFKPVPKKHSASKDSAAVANPLLAGVTKSNEKQSVTEQAEVAMQAQESREPGAEMSPNNSNYMTPDGKTDLQRQINNSQSAKDGAMSGPQQSQ